jgi:hypothetical protein
MIVYNAICGPSLTPDVRAIRRQSDLTPSLVRAVPVSCTNSRGELCLGPHPQPIAGCSGACRIHVSQAMAALIDGIDHASHGVAGWP